jgi:hypothetical protein
MLFALVPLGGIGSSPRPVTRYSGDGKLFDNAFMPFLFSMLLCKQLSDIEIGHRYIASRHCLDSEMTTVLQDPCSDLRNFLLQSSLQCSLGSTALFL